MAFGTIAVLLIVLMMSPVVTAGGVEQNTDAASICNFGVE